MKVKLYVEGFGGSMTFSYQVYTDAIKSNRHKPERTFEMDQRLYKKHSRWLSQCHFNELEDACNCLNSLGARRVL